MTLATERKAIFVELQQEYPDSQQPRGPPPARAAHGGSSWRVLAGEGADYRSAPVAEERVDAAAGAPRRKAPRPLVLFRPPTARAHPPGHPPPPPPRPAPQAAPGGGGGGERGGHRGGAGGPGGGPAARRWRPPRGRGRRTRRASPA